MNICDTVSTLETRTNEQLWPMEDTTKKEDILCHNEISYDSYISNCEFYING